MNQGHLEVICGPMFSGKTTELLKKILSLKAINRSIMVLKPSFDDRYSLTEIVSHDGLKVSAEAVNTLPELLVDYIPTTNIWHTTFEHIFIDEVQFFEPEIIEWVWSALKSGHNITVNGLDMDWKGHPFDNTAKLMAMADKVTKLHAYCSVCGKEATHTFKLAQNGDFVELGGADKYQPRCNSHWRAKTY